MSSLSPTGNLDDLTPLMRQYSELKAQVPDALLFFRMGDFYELFNEDAICASEILEITLTSRDKNKANPTPMAGVPHHSVQGYIQKLLKSGKKIAIGEQTEDPEVAKSAGKIVKREIVRVLTPGIQFDVEGSDANYVALVYHHAPHLWTLACLDVSTGEALVGNPSSIEGLSFEVNQLPIRHLLYLDPNLDPAVLRLKEGVLVEKIPTHSFSPEKALQVLKNHYQLENLHAFIPQDSTATALGILVLYALKTQHQERLAHLQLPEPIHQPKTLILGPNTPEHLDLEDLFQLINKTRSTLGTRQLKRWMSAPLKDEGEIQHRQAAAQEYASRWSSGGERIAQELSQVYDLERICGRVNTQLANPKDSLALGQSLLSLEKLPPLLEKYQSALLIQLQQKMMELNRELHPLAGEITRTQNEEAPLTARDGGIFKKGAQPELDRLISLTENGQRWLVDLETREREKTGIPSLKVRYNRVFGYYIEITQSHLKNVPSHYQRKQTMVGAERFFTDELKTFEEEILTASVKQKAMEQELFLALIEKIKASTPAIMEAARVLGELDSVHALALLGRQPGWVYPEINDSLELEITAGRHPLVDQVKRGSFVPNDLSLSPKNQTTLLITGPNMGGKSTVMRQTALIIILGQMGAPVPARKATWGAVSSLYTRIGAHDAITQGQSTFMVEMSELAHILHHADERSFLILDEIGRGTSTYDGISVAWATLEWICTKIQSRTLFATHYHELTHLSTVFPKLENAHMAVEGTKASHQESLRFLYELRQGPTNESFGIHVAQIAGLPKSVIQRSWKILAELESQGTPNGKPSKPTPQLSLFDHREATPLAPPMAHPVLTELKDININDMTPIQALNFVVKLQSLCTSA